MAYGNMDKGTSSLPADSTGRLRFGRYHERTIRAAVITIWGLLCIFFLYTIRLHLPRAKVPVPIGYTQDFESCSWDHLQHHVSLLQVPPIRRIEHLQRQFTLAGTLTQSGIQALIMEPSPATLYYFNLTSSAFHLSERPFLLILDSRAKFTYLAPKFELSRIADLEMVHMGAKVIGWAEDESPYEVLRREVGYQTVMVDEQARFMVAAGLEGAGFNVIPVSREVQELRAVKSRAEVAILRGINEFTLEVVRALQNCIRVGMSQEEVREAAGNLFRRVGLDGGWALVLFGEQAAHPHGGSSGKTLEDEEFVLIDIGSKLHGYESDVTRTFLPHGSRISVDLLDMWVLVRDAQLTAIARMYAGEMCSAVDEASRQAIRGAGYGEFYTHRLGHGLGLEGHEHPYLNGANNETLKVGEVVTNEPGIYVTKEQAKALGKAVGFGVRHEDAILVTNKGGVPLTGSTVRSPYDP